ncbi:MAG TPA: hypothetical protein VJB58_01980 [Candidatus Paceibacterota bacterium]
MKTVAFFVSLVLVGLPICLGASIGFLTIFDPDDQWKIPPTTDIVLAVVIFFVGIFGLLWCKDDKEELIRRVKWPEHEPERHSGLRRR